MGRANVARSVEQYRDAMIALLPHGAAWSHDPRSQLGSLLMAFADEFARVDARNEQLLKEMDPRGALELMTEWEGDYGLPGPCIHTAQTLADRRKALLAKYRWVGRQDRQFFIDVAADLGYAITITEYNAANPGPQTEYEGIPLTGDAWNYVWQINAPLVNNTVRVYGSQYPGPYQTFGNELLECTLRGLAHTHRVLFFSYS